MKKVFPTILVSVGVILCFLMLVLVTGSSAKPSAIDDNIPISERGFDVTIVDGDRVQLYAGVRKARYEPQNRLWYVETSGGTIIGEWGMEFTSAFADVYSDEDVLLMDIGGWQTPLTDVDTPIVLDFSEIKKLAEDMSPFARKTHE